MPNQTPQTAISGFQDDDDFIIRNQIPLLVKMHLYKSRLSEALNLNYLSNYEKTKKKECSISLKEVVARRCWPGVSRSPGGVSRS